MHNTNLNTKTPQGVNASANVGVGQPTVGYQKQSDYNPRDEVVKAEESKNTRRMIVRILSVIMIIFGILSAIIAAINLISELVASDEADPHQVHFKQNGPFQSASFMGKVAVAIRLLEIINDILIAVQGYLSFKTTSKEHSDETLKMIYRILMFIGVYLVLQASQLIIAYFALKGDASKETDKESKENIEGYNTLVAGILLTTFVTGCCCTCYCCLAVLGIHHYFRRSQVRLENAQQVAFHAGPHPDLYKGSPNAMV